MTVELPPELEDHLRRFGQAHLLDRWSRLDGAQRDSLARQLRAIDLPRLHELYARRDESWPVPDPSAIRPVPLTDTAGRGAELRARGEAAIRAGEVAVLVVAGGQGTRLGHSYPKGMFPVGPVSEKCLFQVHVEKVRALRRRYGAAVPLLVMTSPATDAPTREFFDRQDYFGMAPDEVTFFQQGTMPAVDLATGQLLQQEPGKLALSPNGHGGVLLALHDTGLLDDLSRQGVRHIFYFQVDNPLVKVADPLYLGVHCAADAEVSSKVIPKREPTDKLGNLVLTDGRCSIIEYSDLPEELAHARDEHGRLRFGHGNPAIHIFAVDFLRRVATSAARIPFHLARKKVPHVDTEGRRVEPTRENALKFEMFIFDLLPLAERWTAVETTYEEEFAPLKNESGKDSPQTVRQALSDLAAGWLLRAGVDVPLDNDGHAAVPLEVSPLLALDADELAARLPAGVSIDRPTYLE